MHHLTGERAVSPSASPGDPWRSSALRAVHPSVVRQPIPLVEAIAAGLAAVAVPFELAPGGRADRRYELLLATDQYDAWLIHWPVGTGIAAHDHGGSSGAFAVVSGVLDDEHVHPDGTTTVRRIGAGESVSFDGQRVHAVVNRARSGATSVHVYSPPLRTMTFYRYDDEALVVDRVDEVDVR